MRGGVNAIGEPAGGYAGDAKEKPRRAAPGLLEERRRFQFIQNGRQLAATGAGVGSAGTTSTGAPSGELAAAIVNGMRERRVLISATGAHANVLKIRPPLPFGRAHADQLVTVLSEVLAALLGVQECQPNWDRQAV